MKKIVTASLLATVLVCRPAFAWGHAGGYGAGASHNDFGGRSAHAEGVGATRTNAAGGNTTHVDGEGTTHTSAYGTSSTHYQGADGGYSTHTNQYGDTTMGKAGYGAVTTTPGGAGAYHPPATYAAGGYPAGSYAYHPPTVVNSYSAGCYNCGGWSAGAAAAAGAAVGVATGAAIASANSSAAAANAYSAGVAAGAASATYAMGQVVATVPAGCATPNVQGQSYYLCGNTWFSPAYGANGVYYRVVPAP
jgi:hypothetical protein